ncbi:MAG: hypothetical protein WC354_04460, partial [Candidatus Omnitrophota bacterium]
MKINVNHILPLGTVFEEDISAEALEAGTDITKFKSPVHVKARLEKITNAVIAELEITARVSQVCGRCLKEFDQLLDRKLRLSFALDRGIYELDLDPDIREDIILWYPLQPLCKPD